MGVVVYPSTTLVPGSFYPGEVTSSTTLDKTTDVSVIAYVTLQTSFKSSCAAGQPMQGNMRQLARDRWNYMYPS